MAILRNILVYGCLVIVLFTQVYCERVLPDAIREEIQNHKDAVRRIIDYVKGPGKHQAIKELANITDTYGPRNTGSDALENAIDYMVKLSNDQSFSNVHTENVTAAKWTRGTEWLRMKTPRDRPMALMSLGSSEGTNDTLTGQVIVVKSFSQLDEMAAEDANVFVDKIVLYNQEWDGYSNTVRYRSSGASRAAQYGAKAALIRSVTDYSIYSPHTGQQNYNMTVSQTKIPIAAVTVEDAHLMQRYYDRGTEITIELNMECKNEGDITTRNVIVELEGSTKKDEFVVIGGHIDSWDVGNGVMDDGGGVIISYQALVVLKALNLIPKRTIRSIFWTAEEIGLVGAEQYYDAHKDEHESISVIMESDYGTFTPLGLGFSGTDSARAIMTEVMSLLEEINATGVGPDGSSPDTGIWIDKKQVPGAELWNANDKYFYYHHSDGDSITMEDPDDLDLCLIVWTVAAYVLANLNDKLPRTEIFEEKTSGSSSMIFTTPYPAVVLALLCLFIFKHNRFN